MKKPQITTPLPGPRAKKMIALDGRFVSPSYTRVYPLVAEKQGERLMKGLRSLQQRIECIGDVRGKGLMAAAELVADRHTKAPARKWRGQVIQAAFRRGLLLLGCGENTIRFCPALTVSAAQIDLCLTIFEEALLEVAG